MMRLRITVIAAFLLLSSNSVHATLRRRNKSSKGKARSNGKSTVPLAETNTKELDDDFWKRYIQNNLPSIDVRDNDDFLLASSTPTTKPSPTPSRAPSSEPTRAPTQSPTENPSPAPTRAPSPAPSSLPTRNPTAFPTLKPTRAPSKEPTAVPSKEPTGSPTVAPSSTPTSTPSFQPTSSPTNEQCLVEVQVTCTTASGNSCQELDYSTGSCSFGDKIDVVSFQYLPSPCSSSRNKQGEESVCKDLGTFPEDDFVLVTCLGDALNALSVSPMMLFPEQVATVKSNNGEPLPDTIQCYVMTSAVEMLQIVSINTSGNVSLNLLDRFGAFEIVSCDELACIEDLHYEYELSNVGSAEMEITVVDSTNNENTESLLGHVLVNPLQPGDSTSLEEKRTVNVCTEGSYFSKIDVEADPPNGKTCQAEHEHSFWIIQTTEAPSPAPSFSPTRDPTASPSQAPSPKPTRTPSEAPTDSPTKAPSPVPSAIPSATPSSVPSSGPTSLPSTRPSATPSYGPTLSPTAAPTFTPSSEPSSEPSTRPSIEPSSAPTSRPTLLPSEDPTGRPMADPTPIPSSTPTSIPTTTSKNSLSDGSTLTPQLAPMTRAPAQVPTAYPIQELSSVPSSAPTDEQCLVEAQITCMTSSGKSCQELESSTGGSCSSANSIDVVSFQYHPRTCSSSHNEQGEATSCKDLGTFPENGRVLVTCLDESFNFLSISPMAVFPEQIVTVKSNSGESLPDTVQCYVMTADAQIVQIVSVNTSGNVELNLLDRFGAFEIISCDELACIEELEYEFVISNVGSADMEVTVVNSTHNEHTESLLDHILLNPLQPGDSTSLEEKRAVNVCIEGSYSSKIAVEADPPNGKTCQADDEQSFSIAPPCFIDLEMTCSVDSDMSSCEAIPREEHTKCLCSECVSQMIFRYTAAPCNSESKESNGLITCSDTFTSPMALDPQILITAGDTVLFDDVVNTQTQIVLNDGGGCIGSTLSVYVMDPESGETRQKAEIDTSCGPGTEIVLLDCFGSLQLIGYTCFGEEARNCLVDVTYTLCVENVGGVNLSISEFTLDINGDVTRVIEDVEANLTFSPGRGFQVSKDSTVDRCSSSVHSVVANVDGVELKAQTVCSDNENINFEFQADTRFPTSDRQQTQSPSLRTTDAPTINPTRSPSTTPSFLPTPKPSTDPSTAPSLSPTNPPTTAPAENCVFSLHLACTFANNNTATEGQSCDKELAVVPCLARPTAATMLYTGGDCSQSRNIQPYKFSCEDMNGGPPKMPGEESYIVVTDVKGKGITYFSGLVRVGEPYPLNDGGQRFEADQLITISAPDQSTVLQVVQYHSSCSSNLELKNSFGASQLIQFYNEVQGNVTCFATANFDVAVKVPIGFSGESAILETLTASTNFAGELNLTEHVAGKAIAEGETAVVTLQGVIDLTERKQYSLMVELTATGLPNDAHCSGTESLSFFAGSPSSSSGSPAFTKALPTLLPSFSPAPTPDPLFTPCVIDASITCATQSNPNPSESVCKSLAVPSQPICMEKGTPLQLSWLYNGLPCSASDRTGKGFRCRTVSGGPSPNTSADVHITVMDKNGKKSYFAGVVNLGETFITKPANSESRKIDDKLKVIIATVDNGQAGDILQEMELGVSCNNRDSDVRLLTQFGALKLVAYESEEAGLQSAFEVIQMTYTVTNTGPLTTSIETALIDSTFFGERDLLSSTSVLELGRRQSESFQFNVSLDLYQAQGLQFVNSFFVEGTALQNDLKCNETAVLDFEIGS